MRKLISIVITICMIFSALPVMASGNQTVIELTGETTLLKPPADVTSKVSYKAKLIVDGIETESDFIYSADNKSVKTDADGYVYLTSESEDFTLTVTSAQYPEAKKSILVNVKNGYYENFESYAVNSAPTDWLNNTVVTEENGNKLAVVSAWNSRLLSSKAFTSGVSGEITTSFKYRITSASAADATGFQFGASPEYGAFIDINLKDTSVTTGKMLFTKQDGLDKELMLLEYGKWYDVSCVMDFNSQTYDFYINGNKIAEDFSFSASVLQYDRMFTGRGKSFDEYMILSGETVKSSSADVTVTGSEKLYKPLNDATSKAKYTASLVVDGKKEKSDFLWYAVTNGITVTEDGYVLLDKNTPNGTYDICAVSALNADYSKTFTVTVTDGILGTGNGNWNYNVGFAGGINELNNKQVTFEIQMTPHNATTQLVNVGQSQNWGTYLDYSVENGSIVEKSVVAGTKTILCPFVYDVSQNYRFEYDMANQNYDFYVDGVKKASDRPLPVADMRNIGGKLWFKQSVQSEIAYYSGINAGVKEITGKSVLSLPGAGKTTVEAYKITDHTNDFTGDFYLKDNYDGISIAPDGTLTVTDLAKEGDYKIYATCNSEEFEKTVSVIKREVTLKITGEDELNITPENTSVTGSFNTFWSNGESADVTYTLYPENEFVTVMADGTVTAEKNAKEGTYFLIAETPDGEKVKKQFTVSKFKLEIDGKDTVEFADKTVLSPYTTNGYDCYYTLQPLDKGVVITGSGILSVSENAVPGEYKITATMLSDNSFKGEKTVKIVKNENLISACVVEDGKVVISGDANREYPLTVTATDYYGNGTDISVSVVTNAEGKAEYSLDQLPAGFYKIEANNGFATASVNHEKLLEKNPEEDKFYFALSDMYGLSYETVMETKNSYLSLTEKENVGKICGDNPECFASAVLLVKLKEGETPDENIASALKGILEKSDADIVDLFVSSYNFKETAKAVSFENTASLPDALLKIKEQSILKGVQYLANYREAKKYLALCESEKYNAANEDFKNIIASNVAGKEYISILDLRSAIDKVPLYLPSPGGGGGGGGSLSDYGSSATSGETTSLGTFSTYTYADVPADFWGYTYIERLSEKGIVNGFNGYFNPDKNVTRAEFVKMLCEAYKIDGVLINEFSDVDENEWYAPYVGGAFTMGCIKGENGIFRPNDSITREDAAVIAYRFSADNITDNGTAQFADYNDIADYAKNAVNVLSKAKIINGFTDGSFKPKANTTRAEAAKIIYEIMKAVGRL